MALMRNDVCQNKHLMSVKEFKIQYALGSLTDDMKVTIAHDPRTPTTVLIILSNDHYVGVRTNVAGNINTPMDILKKLSKDGDPWVLRSIIRNPSTPKRLKEIVNRKRKRMQ